MNFILKYYACILGLVRFLGIGVGNEDARASSVFTMTVSAIFGIFFKLLGFNIRSLGTSILVTSVLIIFFITYYSFSKKKNKIRIEHWLSYNSCKNKLIAGLTSLILFVTLIIILLKIYG